MAENMDDIADNPSRQAQINALDIGESHAIAHRMDLTFGIATDAISKATRLLRGGLDKQANRARKQIGAEYTVENGSYLTNAGAIVIVCTITRTA